jgi:hypothetical protein
LGLAFAIGMTTPPHASCNRLSFNIVPYRVQYYLADDTMELLEMRTPNDGRDRNAALWKRARMPRHVIFADSRSRDIEADKGDEDYYGPDDFCVGGSISVMGRKVLLYDADSATFQWYKEHRGIDMRTDVLDTSEAPKPATVVTPPEYLGFGTEEDSLSSFFSLQMRRPRKNWDKINAFDGKVSAGKIDCPRFIVVAGFTDEMLQILRFHSKLANPRDVPDIDREFTVSFFPATDSLAIYEPPKKNSGVLGGKFLSKARLRNPDTGTFFSM